MLRNITLSADEELIALARKKAGAAQSTLNAEFRHWLVAYTRAQDDAAVSRFRDVMQQLGGADAGRSFSRDEMNER
ncbi:MAG: hypothetical protein CFE43_19970 [Burkholderiales bacterium PBB3]|nr:MAG: hypothetical protein CFE43_19970 [Burkholderiales bacterium PBB3]